ncbi:hypothetical protein A9K71_28620 [Mesorhizobium sp. WSM3873]|nr:hypothetical protein A9K71_28620 [Mesorhizobium sp. WSM3873]
MAIVRDGAAKFTKPLEKFATSGSRAKSGLAADAAVARQAVETKSLVKAAEDAAYRVGTGAKLKKGEVLEIIKSIARDPSKVKYQGASFGRAASKTTAKHFLMRTRICREKLSYIMLRSDRYGRDFHASSLQTRSTLFRIFVAFQKLG